MLLNHDSRIGLARVVSAILPKGKVNPLTPNSQTSITIHNTGNPEATAVGHIGAIRDNNKGIGREASWHFTVDDLHIVQHIDTCHEAWHTGAGKAGNATSIGIEICEFADPARQIKAESNAIALVKHLLNGVPSINALFQHNHWSGKDCPRVLRGRANGWQQFVNAVYKKEEPKVLTKDEVDFLLAVLSSYWHRMAGNEELQEYTHFVANRVREVNGRDPE